MEFLKFFVENGLVTILLSGFISYVVANIQLKSNEKNLNKQIDLEISKLKIQHQHERSSANRDYLNKVFFENVFTLRSKLIEYCRLEGKIGLDVYRILKEESLNQEQKLSQINARMADYNASYAIEKSEVDILFIYVPELEEQWKTFSTHCVSMNFLLIDSLLEKLSTNSFTNEDTEFFKVQLDIFSSLSSNLMVDLRNYTRSIIVSLKTSY